MSQQIYDVNGVQVRVISVGDRIIDIAAAIDPEERNEFLRRHTDNSMDWKSSCHTYIYQQALTHYRQIRDEKRREEIENLRALALQRGEEYKEPSQPSRNRVAIDAVIDRQARYSDNFLELEKLINSSTTEIDVLKAKVETYWTTINAQIDKDIVIAQTANNVGLVQELNKLKTNLVKNVDLFLANIDRVKEEVPTERQRRKLFSIQDESSDRTSLGSFIATQMTLMMQSGIDQAYQIRGYGKQLFFMDDAIKALSDGKAQIEVKSFALYGARYNNSVATIPEGMLAAITHEPITQAEVHAKEAAAEEEKKEISRKTKWLSLTPYVDLDDPESVDVVISSIAAKRKPEAETVIQQPTKSEYSWFNPANIIYGIIFVVAIIPLFFIGLLFWAVTGFGLLADPNRGWDFKSRMYWAYDLAKKIGGGFVVFFATLIEAALSVLRFALSIIFLIFVPFVAIWAWVTNDTIANKYHKIDHALSYLNFLVGPAKRWYHSGYQKDLPQGDRKEMLAKVKANSSRSVFDSVVTKYFSCSAIGVAIVNFFRNIWHAIKGFFLDANHAWLTRKSTYDHDCMSAYRSMHQDVFSHQKRFAIEFQERLKAAAHELENAAEEKEAIGDYPRVRRWKPNEWSSAFDFFDDICFGLSDLVVDPMFRKQPGLATTYFVLAHASLGVLFAPPSVASSQYFNWLNEIPAWLSQNFTGKEISESLATQIIGCFLEWKVGFFASEFLLETMQGDFSGLKEIVKQPEKITFGLFALVASGYALGHIPTLPTSFTVNGIEVPFPVGDAINLFSEESETCTIGGTPGLTGLEYAFLGLKFGLLIESLVSGADKAKIHGLGLKKLAQSIVPKLKAKGFLDPKIAAANQEQVKQIIDEVLTEQGVSLDSTAPLYQAFVDSIIKDTESLKSPAPLDPNQVLSKAQTIGSIQVSKSEQINEIIPEVKAASVIDQELAKDVKGAKIQVEAAKQVVNAMDDKIGFFASPEAGFIDNADKLYEKLDAIYENYLRLSPREEHAAIQREKQDFLYRFNLLHAAVPENLNLANNAEGAWNQLQNAVRLVNQMDILGKDFPSTDEANKFFDYLDSLFENYNKLCADKGRFDKQIDKREFLDSFYNKYCFRSVPTIWRILRWIPNMIINIIGGIIRWFINKPRHPHVVQEMRKDRASDKAFWLQILANAARMAHTYVRGLSYLGRAFLFLVAPVTLLVLAYFFPAYGFALAMSALAVAVTTLILVGLAFKYSESMQRYAKWSGGLALHRTQLSTKIRAEYADDCRIAGISGDMRAQCQRYNQRLEEVNPVSNKAQASQSSSSSSSAPSQTFQEKYNDELKNFNQKYSNAQLFTADRQLSSDPDLASYEMHKLVYRLSEAINDPSMNIVDRMLAIRAVHHSANKRSLWHRETRAELRRICNAAWSYLMQEIQKSPEAVRQLDAAMRMELTNEKKIAETIQSGAVSISMQAIEVPEITSQTLEQVKESDLARLRKLRDNFNQQSSNNQNRLPSDFLARRNPTACAAEVKSIESSASQNISSTTLVSI